MLFSMLGNKSKANNPLSPLLCPGNTWHPSWSGSDLCLRGPGTVPSHLGSCFPLLPLARRPCSAGIRSRNADRLVSICVFMWLRGRSGREKSVIAFVCASYKCTTHNKSQFNTVFSDTGINLSAFHCMIHHLRAHHLQGTPKLHRKM